MEIFNKQRKWKFYIEEINSLNNNLLINNDASFNGNIDVIGNITGNNILVEGSPISLLNNDLEYVRNNTAIDCDCRKARFLSADGDHDTNDYMYIEYNSDLVMYDLKMINRRPIRVEVAGEAGFSNFTNQLKRAYDTGYLQATSDPNISNSICLTHNNSDNWHGSNPSSSGQILFSNGNIYIRSSSGKIISISNYFYMQNLDSESGSNVGNSYVVIDRTTGKLYNRPITNPTIVSNNSYVGYLSFTKYLHDDSSVCITHDNNYNWHGMTKESASSGQILFHYGAVHIRSTYPVQFGLSDSFYLYGLASEKEGDEGDAYVRFNTVTNKLYYYIPGSDDRRKHNEVKINNALETIMKLEGFRYDMTETMYPIDYNGEIKDNYRKEAGFIAQSVLKIDELKFTVKGGDYLDNSNNLVEKSYQLNYNAIFTYSVVAIQELKRDSDNKDIIIAEQKNEIESLKEKNLVLENKVDILKNKLNELLTESGKETINF